jgi:hypothetical protein
MSEQPELWEELRLVLAKGASFNGRIDSTHSAR